MVTTISPRGPVMAAAHERSALTELAALLDGRDAGRVTLVTADGRQIELPETAAGLLREVIHALAQERAVAVGSLPKDLTTDQAANLLNVPEWYLRQLLDEGAIPFTTTGTYRRVPFGDLMAFKARRDAERREGLAELTRMSQEMGLYDPEPEDGVIPSAADAAPSRRAE